MPSKCLLPLLALLLLLVASSALSEVSQVDGGILFEYTDASANSVALAGDFNEWNTTATPMEDPDGDGTWSVVVKLKPGSYGYKFVINGGTWVTDPGNPRTGGDYGNSLIDIDAQGKIVVSTTKAAPVPSGTPVISNNTLNSKVYLGGFFRAIMPATSDVPGDVRLRFEHPDDQYNFDVTANLNQKLWASVRLQVRTGQGQGNPNELTTELYKAQANFLEDKWSVQANYNEECFSTDDPFHLLGHEDLRGTIRHENRKFGQGTQGVVFRMNLVGGDLGLSYSDTYDEDIFAPRLPDENTVGTKGFDRRTGTDVVGLRYTRPVGKTKMGVTYRGLLSDWWVNFTNANNTLPDYLKQHQEDQMAAGREEKNVSDNYELANDFHVVAADVESPIVGDFGGVLALAYSWYDARWDLGNREDVQGDFYDDGKVDYSIGNERGLRGKFALDYHHEGLSSRVSYEYQYTQGMDAGEEYITYRTQPGTMVADMDRFAPNEVMGSYVEVNGLNGVDILMTGPTPERSSHDLRWAVGWQKSDWNLDFLLGRERENLGYVDFFSTGAAAFDRTAWRISPRVSWHPFENARWYLGMDSQLLNYDDPRPMQDVGAASYLNFDSAQNIGNPLQAQGYFARMDQKELILKAKLPLFSAGDDGFGVRINLRYINYDGPDGVTIRRLDSDAEGGVSESVVGLNGDFFSSYVGLVWEPSDPVSIQLGFGVDPDYYFVIDPQGWPNGRQQFRERYLQEMGFDRYHPYNILQAEQQLEDRTQIVINAFVRF
ncbi:MAG TPA: isoamylase early set domain-containing protein [Candidatus Krumholzibacteria bacterium]|nr:isoamylase early set domain-containing protein [Candidatus Krumholzibacteria bacterium]